jgi:hypothetical protein
MKQILLTAASCFFAIAAFTQTVQNGGFESWSATAMENPQYYPYTSNYEAVRANLPANVTKVADPQQGNFAIRLETVANASDTMFGYVINGDPNSFAGGIPYAAHPITMSGYFKSNVMPGDTAFVLVIFKEAGVAVSFDIAIFTGVNSAYTSFTLPLTIPVTANPDSVIFGAVSSNAFVSGGIPGSMLQLDNIVFNGVATQPATMNGSFENWTTTSIYTPLGWTTIGDTATRTTDAHAGNYASQMRTIQYDAANAGPSFVTNGTFDGSAILGGRPFTLITDTLCGWYKFTPNGIDSATVIAFAKNNGGNVGANFVGLPPAASYTFFEVPFTCISTPDTLLIVFASSASNTTMSNVGSVLKIDDVYLKSSLLAVPEISWNNFGVVKLYPNPSNGVSWIEWTNNSNEAVMVTVTDALGRVVSQEAVNGNGAQRYAIDATSFEKGIYTVTLSQGGMVTSRRLVVE